MAKITLANVASFQNDTSAVSTVNNNMALITTAMDNTLSRDGTSPNTMNANLDMNSNQILNLPAPVSGNSPARIVDVVSNPSLVLTIPPIGTSGATVGLLNTNLTFAGNNSHTGTNTFSNTVTLPNQTVTAAEIVNNTITNAQIANNTVGNAQLRQGSARTVIGVTGNATANVADIQGTTRQVLAVNTAGTGLVFAQPQGDQLLGTAAADNATAGNVGELLSASAGPTALTTATPLTITSLVLTAGDWDLWGMMQFTGGATTTVTAQLASLSTATNVLQNNGNNYSSKVYNAQTVFNTISSDSMNVGPLRVSTTGTTYFFVAQANFATSTCSAQAFMYARRVR